MIHGVERPCKVNISLLYFLFQGVVLLCRARGIFPAELSMRISRFDINVVVVNYYFDPPQ